MTILKDKLVQSKVLQNFLVDKVTGEPLTNGVVTLYKDNSRTELKNWYYQTGQYPSYSYKTLPNPLTLSAAGTIVDESGNDILPMYYPIAESDNATPEFYYITVVNENGQLQFTRAKFPWIPTGDNPPPSEVSNLKNLIINNRFWRGSGTFNINGDLSNTLTNATDQVVAPSQHDGFSMPDIRFMKSATGATDICTFKRFIPGAPPFQNSIRPEFYINHVCSSTGTLETYKRYQIPISLHISTLDGVSASFSIWLKSNSSVASNTISPAILQFCGTSPSNTVVAPLQLFTNGISPTTDWKQYTTTFLFPSTDGKTYDAEEIQDSAFYLQIDLVPGKSIDVDIAIPAAYLGSGIPTTDFSSYDEIDSIINSSRTGDYRNSLNTFNPFGWVVANDGSIGNSQSNATCRANPDVWPLYNLLWSNVLNVWAPIENSSGSPTGKRGNSAYADFVANNRLVLTKTLGRVISGAAPLTFMSATNANYGSGGTSNFDLVVSSTTGYFTGTPVQLTGITGLSGLTTGVVYYLIVVSATVVRLSEYIEFAQSGSAIDLGSTGNATVQQALGAANGQSFTVDVPNHTHQFDSPVAFWQDLSAGGLPVSNAHDDYDFQVAQVSGPTGNPLVGGVASLSLLNPTNFLNVFIKL